ncbi:HpcH/HpaI aldolase family protein [Rhodoplanes sp. Z2-YC6860]|uniref:HpcH/HpaI aldolase family protein n=1 Tax=Rhodoplanes sp. Z2-YC6860 TaxID=674703 RepID=UPI00078C47AD|nr:aldolase/citrate lyase family protein [Rhodoplanes sp. Z2-YC6860]AMN43223.1 2,4-dihydroxyhept-2-ene-1,7-dioic acid aldolase [Rhodoplanes sp. Z2-YC6860]
MAALPGFSLARRLAAGETVYTGWCALPAPVVAESIAREGFNTVTIDQQHGLWDTAATATAIMAIRSVGAAPVVRIPLGAFAAASRSLDLGAEGIIAPMINTVADAKAFVEATKFTPLGERSWGPMRALTLAGIGDPKAYLHNANENTVTLAMIETRTAMANIDAIAAVPGIDVLFVGPSDLSIELSDGKDLDPHSPAVEAALDRIIAACRKAGKIAGLYCLNAERAVACAKRGMRFLAVGSDLTFLRAGTAAQIKVLKG